MPTRGQVSLGILAGGRGQRLGRVDKAFVEFQGEPLLSRTLHALGADFAEVLLSYNGRDDRVLDSGVRVVPDLRADFPGPLAGLEALLHAAGSEWLLTVPVDLRDIPGDLAETLLRALEPDDAGVVLRDADGLQPLVALWPVRAGRAAATAALDARRGAVHELTHSMRLRVHELSSCRLGNLNSPSDFE